ncbi:hypothetical protein [Jiangella sp. DSM 45060]|uniref:hypothetical protein n=1 Tax=Jiangella sp. DSM 45060 TaxID=1798224 RepID=UPI00087DE8CD|nr:hypothetical protein [Jiangella sp. DSM 45060]SDT61356.1 putative ATP-grasp target RiPP [Jiangella sp. DSM 45060]
MTTRSPLPYGMRFMSGPATQAAIDSSVTYSEELQVLVTADGNPWQGISKGDTSSATNNDSQDDEGTDLW